MQIGEIIKARRKALGLTQVELAQRVRISQGSLSLIERGNTQSLSGSTLIGLASALRIEPTLLARSTEANLELGVPLDDGEAVTMVMKALSPKSQALLRAIAEVMLEQEHPSAGKAGSAGAATRAKSAA